jgi:uncharacterized RDD family membrane protein YckC
MKCPKCGYLGFDDGDRCRNCGFEFSLALSPIGPADASIRRAIEPEGPKLDLDLGDSGPAGRSGTNAGFDLKDVVDAPGAAPPELPLFGDEDRENLVRTGGAPRPRAPLAVRRATPEVPRARTRTPRPPVGELDLIGLSEARPAAAPRAPDPPAPLSRRIAAAVLDATVMVAVDAAIVYLTLRLGGLQPAQWWRVPAIPLIAFLLIVNGGYFVAFTSVGGQSIGKMAFGIRVVGQDAVRVSPAQAAVRVLVGLLSVLPLGLGLLATVFGPDRRPLHDRVARTRVIRPSSI